MYSAEIKKYLMSPVNGRKGKHYNGEGFCETEVRCRTNPDRIIRARVKFKIFVDSGVVREARWEVFGDPVAFATASWCTEQMLNCEVGELAHKIAPERAALALNITREVEIRAGCTAVINSVVNAFNDYEIKQGGGS